MRRRYAVPAVAIACASFLAIPAGASDPAPDKLDAIFAPLAGVRSPGFAVLIRDHDRTLFERGYGVRDLRTFAKIDSHTDFRLASFTKQFTAMAVMLLIHDHKLRYDQPLTELFPGFPAYGQAITVRHLLTHTSGLPDYEDLMDEIEKVKGPRWTPDRQIQDAEVLQLLKQGRPKFAPGASWSYSNSGYVMLGLIVARASGQPFGDFLHRRIFEPLHMDSTLVYVKGRNTVPDRAFGHTRKDGQFTETDQSATSATLGDGGIYSNLGDLAKWDAALRAHRLLSAAEMTPAWTPVKLNNGSQPHWPASGGGDNLNPGKPVAYGYGWFLDPYQEHQRVWHTGSTQGFGTVIERFTKEQLTVIVLCNRTDVDPAKLALQAADVVLAKR